MPFNLFSSRPNGLTALSAKEAYEDDAESLLSHDGTSSNGAHASPNTHCRRRWPALSLTFILLGSHLLTAVISGWLASHWRPFNADRFCAQHTSHYSPVVNEVDIKYSMVDYNGSFFHETVYRGDPSPEVDAAWEDLGVDYRALAVPEAEALKSGIEPDQVRIKAKYGGGYPANVEGLHHLHCLNLLRQSSVYNFDYYKAQGKGAFKNEDHVVKVHITHCLDILRQQLMCTVDTGLLGQVWWNPEKPSAFVDFNTQHKCKNYHAIREWARVRQLPEPGHGPPDLLEPPKPGDRVYAEIP